MPARYLLRFDDLCATMNWELWGRIESRLIDFKIRPILAVVPENQDPTLKVGPAMPDFWDRVRSWQSRGWFVGLHGYQHRYVTHDAGVLGLNKFSEFAGLPKNIQEWKLRSALRVFECERVTPRVWIAPGHSFDSTTVALLRDLGLRVISDGCALRPYRDADGMLWVPQQFARFGWAPFGIWTVCLHHNLWTAADVTRFSRDVERYADLMTDLDCVLAKYGNRQRDVMDDCFAALFSLRRRLR